MTLQDETLPGESPKVERRRSKIAAFRETIAAARNLSDAEGSVSDCQWALGDALIKECGGPGANGRRNGSADKLKQAAAALANAGYPYSAAYLRDFRKVAATFSSPADRSAAWSICRVAKSPEKLRAAEEQAKRDGALLTKAYVAQLLKAPRGIAKSKPNGFVAVEECLMHLTKVEDLIDKLSLDERSRLAKEARALAAALEAEHHKEAE